MPLLLAYGVAVAAPATLVFPYSARIGSYTVHAESPIDAAVMARVLARADARLQTTPLLPPRPATSLYLTNGGWRWKMLSNASAGAFAISRPVTSVVVINRNDPAADSVTNGRDVGGRRTLSGTIAHEVTHNLLRRHFGQTIDWQAPAWKLEGYCDYVAGGGSLSDAEAATLITRHETHPALPYYLGRKRVAAELRANHGSVDRLFGHDS